MRVRQGRSSPHGPQQTSTSAPDRGSHPPPQTRHRRRRDPPTQQARNRGDHQRHRNPRRHHVCALRRSRPRPLGAGSRYSLRKSRGHDCGTHRRGGNRTAPSCHRNRHDQRLSCSAGNRGVHPGPQRSTSASGTVLFADDRHRTIERRRISPNRVGQSPDFCRRPAHGHLRSTNQRRAHRLRRQGCALPVWIEDQPFDGSAPRFASPRTRSVGRPVSDPGRHEDHPPLGRSARCATELDTVRQLRPC